MGEGSQLGAQTVAGSVFRFWLHLRAQVASHFLLLLLLLRPCFIFFCNEIKNSKQSLHTHSHTHTQAHTHNDTALPDVATPPAACSPSAPCSK